MGGWGGPFENFENRSIIFPAIQKISLHTKFHKKMHENLAAGHLTDTLTRNFFQIFFPEVENMELDPKKSTRNGT